jgi:hypothetical protein
VFIKPIENGANVEMKPVLDRKEEEFIKDKIAQENEQIILNNTAVSVQEEPVSAEPKLVTDTLKKKVATNLNYTPVP